MPAGWPQGGLESEGATRAAGRPPEPEAEPEGAPELLAGWPGPRPPTAIVARVIDPSGSTVAQVSWPRETGAMP
eukprot:6995096-Alexandrium_andersonii.AAC.1